MTTELAERPAAGVTEWTPRQEQVIKNTIAPGITDDELAVFKEVCLGTGLNPFARQIYAIPRGRGNQRRMTIQTGIDGFRLVADRSGKYAGQEGPQWCGEDGQWADVWLHKYPPIAARVGVLRTDWTQVTWGVALWTEYAQMTDGRPTAMWAKMPALMLAKCAESLALRKAFPANLSGVYTDDEMAQADNPPPRELKPSEQPPLTQAAAEAGAPKPAYTKGDAFRRALAELKDLPVPSAEADMRFNWVADTFGEDSEELREVRDLMDTKLVGEAA